MKFIFCDYNGIIKVDNNFDCSYCDECDFCPDNCYSEGEDEDEEE